MYNFSGYPQGVSPYALQYSGAPYMGGASGYNYGNSPYAAYMANPYMGAVQKPEGYYWNKPIMAAQAVSSPDNTALGVQGGQMPTPRTADEPTMGVSPQTKQTMGAVGGAIGSIGQGIGSAISKSASQPVQYGVVPYQDLSTPLSYGVTALQFRPKVVLG